MENDAAKRMIERRRYYAERADLMIDMRKQKYTYKEIGKAVGLCAQRVKNVIDDRLRRKLSAGRQALFFNRIDTEYMPTHLQIDQFRASWREWLPFIRRKLVEKQLAEFLDDWVDEMLKKFKRAEIREALSDKLETMDAEDGNNKES